MGWGAAQQYYEDNSDWLNNPEEAYEVLYGSSRKPKKTKQQKSLKPFKCRVCKKGFYDKSARRQHIRDTGHRFEGKVKGHDDEK
ncbi:MAG: hypothetical protein GY938_24415 [Ketobacter sp.]|nr:hypothetical protein [Ketobacter sp.]